MARVREQDHGRSIPSAVLAHLVRKRPRRWKVFVTFGRSNDLDVRLSGLGRSVLIKSTIGAASKRRLIRLAARLGAFP